MYCKMNCQRLCILKEWNTWVLTWVHLAVAHVKTTECEFRINEICETLSQYHNYYFTNYSSSGIIS
jgi:hypothetical protein